MKIAVIGIRGLPANYGGFETCAEHVSKYWVDKNNEVLIYCRKSHYTSHPKEINGRKLKYINSIPIKGVDTLAHSLFSILNLIFKHSDYKNIHLYNSGNGIFVPLLKLFGKNVIVSVDGIEWKRQKWGTLAKLTHKIGAKLAVKYADKVITDNQEVYNVYKKELGVESTIIAYGAKFIPKTDPNNSYLKKHNLISKNYFIFIGRFVPEKCVHHLIQKFLLLQTDMPLVIIGDDTNDTEYKNSLFSEGNKHSNIIMPGFLYGDEYEALLSNAYLYVTASELEGTSPSLLAAMGAKVCTLVNGIDENLQTIGGSGTAFNKCDYNDLQKKWQEFIDNKALTTQMAEIGYQHVYENYRWESIADQYIEVFENT